jgi:hypothetical protein
LLVRGKREQAMARKYSRSASKDVKSAMHRRKRGSLKRGKGGRGGTVKSRKQAIAIGLSEARRSSGSYVRTRTGQNDQTLLFAPDREARTAATPFQSSTAWSGFSWSYFL